MAACPLVGGIQTISIMATEVFAKTPIGLICAQITQDLVAHPMSVLFRKPVTDESFLAEIQNPMDLETIKKKLKDGSYTHYKEWEADIELIFDNSIRFNGQETVIGGLALYMQQKARKMISKLKWFNHQNFEEYIRSVYREIARLTTELTNEQIETTPRYEIKELSDVLNALSDTTEVEQILKKGGEQRILKKAKDGVIDLDGLSRKTLDTLWKRFGNHK